MNEEVAPAHDSEETKIEGLRHWQSLPPGERLAGVWEVTRQSYIDQGVGIDYWPSDRRIRRVEITDYMQDR
jgi:hypothetical protein